MLRKLPLSGVQTFADVINDYAVYVDKTTYTHSMIFGKKERNIIEWGWESE
jgi:hypothetical protein